MLIRDTERERERDRQTDRQTEGRLAWGAHQEKVRDRGREGKRDSLQVISNKARYCTNALTGISLLLRMHFYMIRLMIRYHTVQ